MRFVPLLLLALAVGIAAHEAHRVRNLSALISFAGLVPVNETDSEFFYWFFPALNRNASAPVVMWLQGGPGCSSMLGLFFEHGPLSLVNVDPTLPVTPLLNNNTWANYAHMLYVDNPVGVGFSSGPNVTTMEDMASQLYLFLQNWFSLYPQYARNEFYVFGESYGGKYVPSIAAYIMQQNAKRAAPAINFMGIGIGNGITDPINQVQATQFMADFGFLGPLDLVKVNQMAQQVVQDITEGDFMNASLTRLDIYSVLEIASGGVNIYDCRTFQQYNWTVLSKYLSQASVQAQIHVSGRTYAGACFNYASLMNDSSQSVKPQVEAVLAAGYKVLLYQGQFDLRDGVASNQAWIPTMAAYTNFNQIGHTVWTVNGAVAGYARTQDVLTQVIVAGAGHMAPMNQPYNTLDMFYRYITNTPFSTAR